jgi:glycosyltransferase involved in cell wall biosynthesis
MRVLHVVPTYLPATRYGGPIYSVHGLCVALAADGHEVHVFTTNVDGEGDSAVPLGRPVTLDGVQVWYFPSRRLRRLYWSPEMGRALRAEVGGFDLVHLHSVFLWPTWAAARAARRVGVPYVLSPRGMLVRDLIRRKSRWLKTAWIGLIERRNLGDAAAVHLTSATEEADFVELGLPASRVVTIPNGVDPPSGADPESVAADLRGLADRQPLVLCLGRISWKKGLDCLISAMSEVPGAHLAIVGNDEEGYLPALEAMVAEAGLSDRVHLVTRFVGPSEKAFLFETARLFVLASYSENFGNVVLEALSHGCPVITVPEVGAHTVVKDSGGGLVVDRKGMGSAIRAVLSDPETLTAMGRAARPFVTAHYGWPRIAEQMSELYGRVTGP